MSWSSGEPWVVTATGPSSWVTVAAALLATGGDRVAAVVIGPADAELLRSVATTYVAVPVAARADDVVRIATALAATHDRVVVTAPEGLLAPLGGFTLADVAWALRAPVAVAADSGSANDVLLTLEVLERRRVAAAVIAVGPIAYRADLPVPPGGEIPADAADRPDFAERAHDWLDPLFHAGAGEPAAQAGGAAAPTAEPTASAAEPATPATEPAASAGPEGAASPAGSGGGAAPAEAREPAAVPSRRIFTGKRVAVAALILAVAALQMVYMISLFTAEPTAELEQRQVRGEADVNSARIVPPVPGGRAVASPVDAGCSRPNPEVVTSWPDAATTARVNAAWARIEAALAARAPAVAASLRPGATRNALLAAHVQIGVPFPADLVASLQRHDGTDPRSGFSFPPFHRYLSLDEAYRQWLATCRTTMGVGLGGDWWHRSYVPFAGAGDGGLLLLDQRPGANGRVGDYYPDEGTRFEGRPRSLTEMLEAVATSLETGQPYDGRYRPVVEPDGTLRWAW